MSRDRLALSLAAAALVMPAAASAHVIVVPDAVESGVAADVAFETPNERAPHATVELAVTAPPSVEIVSADAPAGWTVSTSGSTATWSGGRIEGTQVVAFPVRVLARVGAGTYAFAARQGYSDGSVVSWEASFFVLPSAGGGAPAQEPGYVAIAGSERDGARIQKGQAVVIGAVGLAVVAASVAGVWLLRRRSLQDR